MRVGEGPNVELRFLIYAGVGCLIFNVFRLQVLLSAEEVKILRKFVKM